LFRFVFEVARRLMFWVASEFEVEPVGKSVGEPGVDVGADAAAALRVVALCEPPGFFDEVGECVVVVDAGDLSASDFGVECCAAEPFGVLDAAEPGALVAGAAWVVEGEGSVEEWHCWSG
jgi:hypothetical protein